MVQLKPSLAFAILLISMDIWTLTVIVLDNIALLAIRANVLRTLMKAHVTKNVCLKIIFINYEKWQKIEKLRTSNCKGIGSGQVKVQLPAFHCKNNWSEMFAEKATEHKESISTGFFKAF